MDEMACPAAAGGYDIGDLPRLVSRMAIGEWLVRRLQAEHNYLADARSYYNEIGSEGMEGWSDDRYQFLGRLAVGHFETEDEMAYVRTKYDTAADIEQLLRVNKEATVHIEAIGGGTIIERAVYRGSLSGSQDFTKDHLVSSGLGTLRPIWAWEAARTRNLAVSYSSGNLLRRRTYLYRAPLIRPDTLEPAVTITPLD